MNVTLRKVRTARALLADELGPADMRWDLCVRTGRPYDDLIAVASSVAGDRRRFLRALGYSESGNGNWLRWDGGWWRTICQWLAMYVPQFEGAVRSFVSEDNVNKLAIMEPDARERVVDAASKALNIAPEVLTHFIEHRAEIELFLEAARATLGTLAESKLWELVMNGDAATIRWLLPRIKGEVFGDRTDGRLSNVTEDRGPRTIRIIDVGEV